MERFTTKLETSQKPHSRKWLREMSWSTIEVEHPDDYNFEKLPIETLQMTDIIGCELSEKMNSISSAFKVTDMAEMLRNGTYTELPMYVQRYQHDYQAGDGHHRYHAQRIAGVAMIEAKVISEEDIRYTDVR